MIRTGQSTDQFTSYKNITIDVPHYENAQKRESILIYEIMSKTKCFHYFYS